MAKLKFQMSIAETITAVGVSLMLISALFYHIGSNQLEEARQVEMDIFGTGNGTADFGEYSYANELMVKGAKNQEKSTVYSNYGLPLILFGLVLAITRRRR